MSEDYEDGHDTGHQWYSQDSGFWRVNIGHVGTVAIMLLSMGMMYGSMANKIEVLEARTISTDQRTLSQANAIAALQISDAARAQDQADLHRTIESDFNRRLSKLEDRANK